MSEDDTMTTSNDDETTTPDPAFDRRRLFIGAGGLLAAGLVVAACGKDDNTSTAGQSDDDPTTTAASGGKGDADSDLATAKFAASLEVLAVNTYGAALDAATGGALGTVPPAVAEFVTVAKQQHQTALDSWNDIVTDAGDPKVTNPPHRPREDRQRQVRPGHRRHRRRRAGPPPRADRRGDLPHRGADPRIRGRHPPRRCPRLRRPATFRRPPVRPRQVPRARHLPEHRDGRHALAGKHPPGEDDR